MRESPEHAALVELFRHHPEVAVTLAARVGGLALPAVYSLRIGDSTLRAVQIAPDLIIELVDADGKVVRVLAIEVQRDIDPDKLFSWPSYQWLERHRRRCDCSVVVIATRRDVAAWAAGPIVSVDSVTRLIVLGPDDVPWISDLDEACENPALAVLSAAIHGGDDAGQSVVRAASAALEALPPHERCGYNHLVFRSLGRATIDKLLEDIMLEPNENEVPERTPEETNAMIAEIKRDIVRRWVEAEMMRPVLLRLLGVRGFTVTEEIRARIEKCRKPAVINAWIDRIIPAKTLEDVFAD